MTRSASDPPSPESAPQPAIDDTRLAASAQDPAIDATPPEASTQDSPTDDPPPDAPTSDPDDDDQRHRRAHDATFLWIYSHPIIVREVLEIHCKRWLDSGLIDFDSLRCPGSS